MANDVSDMDAHCAALILAAGRGTRFGGEKMLADVDGRPMLQHVLDLTAGAGFEPVVVVLGDDADEIERRIRWHAERRVRNPSPGRGLSSSLALGIEAIGEHQRVLVLLGDQPYLTIDQISAIISTPRDPMRPIVAPRYADGHPGNPVLLEREAYALAAALEGDRGMSQLFSAHPDLVRYVDVAGTNPDIDTPDDARQITPA
jgi:molybdenum cofactor cytidylyltransferase